MTEKRKMLLSILLAVVMTFSMIPMIGGSTANAVAYPEITLEFGTGHETLAANVANYLNGDESPLLDCNASADGSKVKFYWAYKDESVGGVQRESVGGVQRLISEYLSQYLIEYIDYPYLDNGDMPHSMNRVVEIPLVVGQQTLDKYTSDKDIYDEIWNSDETEMRDKQTFYVLWDKPINNVSLSVKPPVCGVETKINDDETQTNPPQVTITGQNYSFERRSYWYDLKELKWFRGIFKGGEDYVADSNLIVNFGYYFPENVKCSIEGGSIVSPEDFPEYPNNPIIRDYYWLGVYYRVKAVHNPGTPVKEKEVKQTCTKNGSYEEVTYCKACKEEVSREKKTVKALGHKWSEWKVTKKATSKAEGEKQRVCTVCGEIEKSTIPKLKKSGPLMVKMVAKGKDKLKVSWSKINRAAGYVIFMNKCKFNGKVNKLRKVVTIPKNNKFKWTAKELEENTCYKLCIRAYKIKNGKKKFFRKSPLLHAFTGNFRGEFTNVKAVKVKKKKVTLAKGKTFRIKARAIKKIAGKKLPVTHAPVFRYRSSNTDIVKVTSKGKIKAKKEGKAKVYVYAHNGKSKAVKVTVE